MMAIGKNVVARRRMQTFEFNKKLFKHINLQLKKNNIMQINVQRKPSPLTLVILNLLYLKTS